MTIKPIPKQKVIDEMTSYGNCSDFLHDIIYDYYKQIFVK